jgi:SAM-dependent methyltransferase
MPHRSEELFASTAPYYARYRAGYAPELYTHLTARFGLDSTRRVLDIGTGTGTIALALAGHVREVVALDPEPGMLAEGRRLADERGVATIDWRLGDSNSLGDMDLGAFNLATLGQSFHWTDRDKLLVELDDLLDPAGAVVIVGGPAPGTIAPAPWLEVIAEVRTRYLGPDRRAGSGTYSHPKEPHQEVVARSPFSRLETVGWDRTVYRSLQEVIGLQLSYSFSSPAQLGPDRAAFEEDLRTALTAFNPSGRFEEHVRTEAIIATRP